MSYQDNEAGLVQLFQKLEPIQGTFPPVYMLDDILIGYDKLEHLTVLASIAKRDEALYTESDWVKFLLKKWMGRLKQGVLSESSNRLNIAI